MKRFLILIFLSVFVLSMVSCTASDDLQEKCIRIHIRADSNNEVDQDVKLLVRDNIVAYLTPLLSSCDTKDEAKAILIAESNNLVSLSNRVLENNGFTYKASISLKKEEFPYRTYNGTSFPSGVYDALIINLGSGEGDNWWCVCFPPLCFQSEDEDFKYKSRLKEWFSK